MQTALNEKERASTQKCWQVIFSCETPEQHMLVQQIMLPKIEFSQAFKYITHGLGYQTATKRQPRMKSKEWVSTCILHAGAEFEFACEIATF